MIVGIILLTITIFVHKHTYWKTQYNKREYRMPLPIWLVILMAIPAFVPILNIIVFATGLVAYCMYRCDPPYGVTPYFKCELGWWKALIWLLTREI